MPYTTVPSAAGTTIRISAAAPATEDADGFAGTTSFTSLGIVTEISGLPRPSREISDKDTFNGFAISILGGNRVDEMTVTAVCNDTDTGQALAEAHQASGEPVTVEINPPGAIRARYFRARVTQAGISLSGPNDEVSFVITFKPMFNDAGIVIFKAAA